MKDSRHTQVKEIFAAACLEPPLERYAFLARTCGEDQAMRREVESLLAFHDDGGAATRHTPARVAVPTVRYSRGRILAGRYRIERLLGVGGMGEVYSVYDGLLRQTVALKILHHADAPLRRRLVEEVRLARQVTHPGVCRVYDIGDDAGTPFLTMELIEGEDLATRLERSGPLPSAEVVAIGLQLASALAAAHEAGVLHRDLKPSNVLVARRGGGLYITDFGIATSRGRTNGEGRRLGTPAYMAPEEAEPGGVVTERSDLYSLGLLLYEVTTGLPAFDASDVDSLLELQRFAAPEPPSRLVAGVDPALEALILRLLAKEPALRPSSARAVLAELERSRSAPMSVSAWQPAERRQIVSLVCRVAAPPVLTAEPEWSRLIRIFHARATAACRLKGGRVARHLADGLVVHFGVPSASDRDGESAVRAGLEIVAELALRPLVPPEQGRLSVSVAVDTVSAMVRGRHVITPHDHRLAKTVAGTEEIGAASDEPNTVVLGESLVPQIRSAFALEAVARAGGERRFRVTGPRDSPGLEIEASQLTPLANRHLELASMDRWWNDASSGRGQVVLLSGEPGIGKSRMVQEMWQRIRIDGIGLEARCSSFHVGSPLHPFLRMVAQAGGLDGGDRGEARTAKLRRLLAPLGARGDDLLPVLSSWLSATADPIGASSATSETDQRAFIGALQEWILALAEQKPLLVVCEDVQWSDVTSHQAIDRLIGLAPMTRILLVLTFRPDFTPPWKRTGLNQLVIQPLAPQESRTLIESMRHEAVREMAAIVDRADGNPLFLEELIHHQQEASSRLETDAVPLSLWGLLGARLDRLGSAKRIAQAASVCDRAFSYGLLAAITATDRDASDLETGVARLIDAEILFQRGPVPRASFVWKHALLREAAYASLPNGERRRLHAATARALADLEPETAASRPELVARHWTDAGRPAEAYGWWRRAGLRAVARSAYVEAAYALEQALRTLARAVPDREDRRRRELELRLGLTFAVMGKHGPGSIEASRCARQAEALCRGLDPDDDIARALYLTARVRLVRGDLGVALRLLQPLAAIREGITDPRLRSAILAQAGNLNACMGRLDDAEALHAQAVTVYDRADKPMTAFEDPRVHLQFMRALVSWLRGRRGECLAHIEAGIAHADALETRGQSAVIRVNATPLALLAGDDAWFARLLRDGSRQATEVGSIYLMQLAAVFTPLGEPSLAPADRAQRMRSALADSERGGYRLFRSLALAEVASLEAAGGHLTEALLTIEEATKEAKRRTDRFFLPEILRRRGDLLASAGERDRARSTLRRSLRAAQRSGAFCLELRASLSLARLLAADRRYDAARHALSSVISRLPDDVDAPERADTVNLLRTFPDLS
jgi:tetratricopeptide (TPR) repeat protein